MQKVTPIKSGNPKRDKQCQTDSLPAGTAQIDRGAPTAKRTRSERRPFEAASRPQTPILKGQTGKSPAKGYSGSKFTTRNNSQDALYYEQDASIFKRSTMLG